MRVGFEIDFMLLFDGGVVEEGRAILLELRAAGHKIVLYTSRDSSAAFETEAWLDKNKIPYDAIIFNRPRSADLFFAPNFRQFTSWDSTRSELVKYGFIQERKARHEDTARAEGRRAKKDKAAGHQGPQDVDPKSGGAGGAEPEAGRPGFQVLK